MCTVWRCRSNPARFPTAPEPSPDDSVYFEAAVIVTRFCSRNWNFGHAGRRRIRNAAGDSSAGERRAEIGHRFGRFRARRGAVDHVRGMGGVGSDFPFAHALIASEGVLIIECPYALGLEPPKSIMVGIDGREPKLVSMQDGTGALPMAASVEQGREESPRCHHRRGDP
jgi:hypothetical protein